MATDYFDTTGLDVVDGTLAEAGDVNQIVAATDSAFDLVSADIEELQDIVNTHILGSYTTAPTVDKNGDALQEGAIYYNSVNNQLYVYDSGVWVDAYNPLSSYSTRLTTAESDINTAEAAIVSLDNRLDTTESNITTLDSTRIKRDGTISMTGELTLSSSTPSSVLKAASKGYVDTQDTLAVPKTGGTMTGALVLSGAPTIDLHASTKKYVDDSLLSAFPDATTTTKGKIELATSTEALSGTDDTRAVTSAGLASGKLFDSQGYYKLPGGLILQWGLFEIQANTSSYRTLPVPWPNGMFVGIASPTDADNNDIYSLHVYPVSSETIGITNTSGFIVVVNWFAIGY